MKREERVQLFVEELWKWFSRHKRELPWRDLLIEDDTQRAYMILVSEIMLQQTQVPRVIVTFKEFLRTFPTLDSLAGASNRDVLIAWRGMGYNSRALRLRDAAKAIIGCELRVAGYGKSRNSKPATRNFPRSMEELTAIPGIGNYTAAAIRNFAFNIPTPCLDTNIRRILHRVFVGPENIDGSWEKDDGYLLAIASEALDEAMKRGTAADWHAALMDFGSLVQTKRNPKWDICPLTARGIMKVTKKSFELRVAGGACPELGRGGNLATRNPKPATNREPGREVGGRFVPNRIFRGRIVEALRDEKKGLNLHQLGAHISVDWDRDVHKTWLDSLLKKLLKDRLIRAERGKYVLG